MGYQRTNFADPAQAPTAPCTENRLRFVQSLLAERDLPQTWAKKVAADMKAGMDNATAKEWIGKLMPLPRVEREDAPTEAGYYRHDGEIYKVQQSKKTNRLYALVRDEFGKWDIAKGMIFHLSSTELMTAAQVKKAGLA